MNIDKKDVKLLSKKSNEGGVNLVKRETIINAPMETVYEFFCNQAKLVECNEKLIVSEVVEKFNDQASLLKREVKGNFLVSNRDMCVFWLKLVLTDGSLANIQYSIEHEKIPETKCVRAMLHISLLHVKAISDTR